MLIALTMPQFGEFITQARIVHWLKKEGDDAEAEVGREIAHFEVSDADGKKYLSLRE